MCNGYSCTGVGSRASVSLPSKWSIDGSCDCAGDISIPGEIPDVQRAAARRSGIDTRIDDYKAVTGENGFRAAHSLEYPARRGDGLADEKQDQVMQRLLNGGGITVTEIAPMDGPVDVCPETIAAFVGRALRGPLNTPVLLRNCAEFRRRFGGIWPRSSLGIAVEQFFDHGGKQLYVVRVANGARGAMIG